MNIVYLFDENYLGNEKFEHLNVAWHKYEVKNLVDSNVLKLVGNYEYFCSLCNKALQKKQQLVDVSKIIFKIYFFLIIKNFF